MCSVWWAPVSEFEAYRGLFVAESRENHENLVMNLLLLEKGSDQNVIDEIFRSIHTLKGASASMGFSQMERLCHAMEDVLSLVRSGAAYVSPELGNILLACSDLIEQMLDDIDSGGDSSSKNPDFQVRALRQWLEQADDRRVREKEILLPQDGTESRAESSPIIIETENCPEYEICITVASECIMKDVRAMLALGNLDTLGTILSIHPSREAIDEGRFDGTFRLVIASDAGVEALKTAASGTEISRVEIRQAEKQPILTPGGEQVAVLRNQAADSMTETPKPPAPSTAVPEEGGSVTQKAKILTPGEGAGEMKPTDEGKKQSSSGDKTREIKNLRVDIHQLDHIMNLIEDLVINRGRLKQIAGEHRIKEMDEAIGMVDRSVSELQQLMMNIRMIPLNHIFNRLPRVVRDVAQYDGKEVEFVVNGGETELDRSVMDGLNDPLLHLIRNAVNHGIESPETRKKAGKPQKGCVTLSAHRDQDNVIIELIDDGAGINVDKVKAKAIEKGLITPETAETFTADQAIELLFQPGFSTADKISDISGRGVGLDVVRRSIEALNGTIRVETTLGKGSRFELVLPPTMAIVDVMIVRINGKRFGIPISSIVEVANFRRDTTHHIGKGEAILLRNEVLQILRLDEMAGVSPASDILVVVQYQKRKCCIPVDMVEGKQEVVVKPLSSFIGVTRGVSGVTILGDGTIIPVLDVNSIV
jgi:two-component system, chemotaxis family, sensor kinase CheA